MDGVSSSELDSGRCLGKKPVGLPPANSHLPFINAVRESSIAFPMYESISDEAGCQKGYLSGKRNCARITGVDGGSSNGRTADSESVNRGSNPCPSAIKATG